MTYKQPILNLKMPKSCPGVDAAILNPRNTWPNPADYDATATKLRDMFRKNFDSMKRRAAQRKQQAAMRQTAADR